MNNIYQWAMGGQDASNPMKMLGGNDNMSCLDPLPQLMLSQRVRLPEAWAARIECLLSTQSLYPQCILVFPPTQQASPSQTQITYVSRRLILERSNIKLKLKILTYLQLMWNCLNKIMKLTKISNANWVILHQTSLRWLNRYHFQHMV